MCEETEMHFRTEMCVRLVQYKENDLVVKECDEFRNKVYGHILPKKQRELNILERYRDCFFASDHAAVRFHHCFHHLNSSQALCINLFYPLVVERSLGLFLD